MAKVSPWATAHEIPALARDTKTFRDPKSGFELTLTFEELDEPGIGRTNDRFEAYVERYLGAKPQRFALPVVPARSIELSRHLLRRIALFEAMERPPAGEEPYGIAEWLGIALKYRDTIWTEVYEWAVSLGAMGSDVRPNDFGAATGTSSEPPSASSTGTPSGASG